MPEKPEKSAKGRALWGEARRQLAAKSKEVANQIEDKTGGRASRVLDSAGRAVNVTAEGSKAMADAAVKRGAETGAGASMLDGARAGLEVLAELPLLTIVGDGVQARHGVVRLRERLLDDPFDPMPPVWLADALLRAQREHREINVVRTALNPVRGVLRAGAGVIVDATADEQAKVPVVTQLLARAYVLSLARLDGALTGHELHALSRVNLARGAVDQAIRLAQGAIAVGGDEAPLAAVTLARAHGQRGQFDLAWQAAKLAVDSGSTVGYQVIAELPAPNGGEAADEATSRRGDPPGDDGVQIDEWPRPLTVDERSALLGRVSSQDLADYQGVAPTTRGAAGDVARQQRDRFKAQSPRLRSAVDRLKGGGRDDV